MNFKSPPLLLPLVLYSPPSLVNCVRLGTLPKKPPLSSKNMSPFPLSLPHLKAQKSVPFNDGLCVRLETTQTNMCKAAAT